MIYIYIYISNSSVSKNYIPFYPPFCWLHPQRTPPCSQPRVGAAAEPRRHRSGLPLGPSGRKVCTQAGWLVGWPLVKNNHNIWVNHLDISRL